MINYKDFKIEESDLELYEKKGVKYSNDILTFDIETTSYWLDDNRNVITYQTGYDDDYWNNLTPSSLCYIWQFSFNDKVYYGRNLYNFITILAELEMLDVKFIIYVHNLSYEFQFLLNILTPKKIFARQSHKPIYFTCVEFENITFRCSYMLTRLSLETWGNNIGTYKLHTLDYTKLRTPFTKLTSEELEYCKMDCLVMFNGLKKYKEKYGYIDKIPLTQTGEVRRPVKKKLFKVKGWVQKMLKSLPKSITEYERFYKVFSGGYTHSNHTLTGYVHTTGGQQFDFASSYPYVMIAFKFPVGSFYISDYNEKDIEDYAYILKLELVNIECNRYNTFISLSKCEHIKNPTIDNGRIIACDYAEIYVTEQDFITIKETYNGCINIVRCWKCRKEYLPTELVDYILELYENKTKLKGVEEKEDIYMQSKQYINSLFGMSVTAIVNEDYDLLDDFSWKKNVKSLDDIKNYLEELEIKPKGRVFLSFPIGIWVTSYAKRNLWKCILKLDNGSDINNCIYCDTDSIKCLGFNNDFTEYNKEVVNRLRKACEYHGLDYNRTKPVNPKGKVCQLGLFEEEEPWKEFITLGAKRYCYRTKDDKLHLTVSGVNKGAVKCLKNDINNFKNGFVFNKDNESVTTKQISYTNDQPTVTFNDGFTSDFKHGINMRNRGYTISLDSIYLDLIEYDSMEQGVFL